MPHIKICGKPLIFHEPIFGHDNIPFRNKLIRILGAPYALVESDSELLILSYGGTNLLRHLIHDMPHAKSMYCSW
jgi:hypothetical protein